MVEKLEDIMTAFHRDAKAKFGISRLMTARVTDLFVEEVGCAFEVRETDGEERLWDVSKRREIVVAVAGDGSPAAVARSRQV